MSKNWAEIPDVLKKRNQWCIASDEKQPMTVSQSINDIVNGKATPTLKLANVVNPNDFMSFEKAAYIAKKLNLHIGFVLTENGGITCIDIDVNEKTTAEQKELYYRILVNMNSWAEQSVSGKGIHIWCFGSIGKGVKRDGIEIYSQKRFIITTGVVVHQTEMVDCQDKLDNMVTQMRKDDHDSHELVEIEPVEDDWSVLLKCQIAVNQEKFDKLYTGDWRNDYPSQSEADLALMSIFAFHSQSNQQCIRLFKDSALGQRAKANRDDYLIRTLKIIRSRQARDAENEITLEDQIAKMQHNFLKNRVVPITPPETVAPRSVTFANLSEDVPISYPPGFVGRLAHYIYRSSIRPVEEIAITASLAIMAGLAGKAWNIPQSGLNLFLILIAKSGTGKEALHTSTSNLIQTCSTRFPMFGEFFDFNNFASGPALLRACVKNPCFVNMISELGKFLQRMSDDTYEGPSATLRQMWLALYSKSSHGSIAGGVTYSDQDKNTGSTNGVAYSLCGETTPSLFWETMNEGMMADGFISRFIRIEYHGDRVSLNKNPLTVPDEHLIDGLCQIASIASTLMNTGTCCLVTKTEEVEKIFNDYEEKNDALVIANDNDSYRQMYIRASLKALRVAGLLAVGDNPSAPKITKVHAEWAINLIEKDIQNMKEKFLAGDIGNNDAVRIQKLQFFCKQYLEKPPALSYKVNPLMHQAGIVPRSYLQVRTSQVPAFYKKAGGQNNALEATIKNALENGWLVEVSKVNLIRDFGFTGRAFRIMSLD